MPVICLVLFCTTLIYLLMYSYNKFRREWGILYFFFIFKETFGINDFVLLEFALLYIQTSNNDSPNTLGNKSVVPETQAKGTHC